MGQRKLLIIDDEAELREILVSLFEDHDIDISVASNGVEAIAQLATHIFDAILSDERMPKKTGLQVLQWMHDRGLKTPFIIHSGYSGREAVAEAQRLGVYAFIDKP